MVVAQYPQVQPAAALALLTPTQRVAYWLAILELHPRLWACNAWEATLFPVAFSVKPEVSAQFSRHPLLDGANDVKPEAARDHLVAFAVRSEAVAEGDWLAQPIFKLLASKVAMMAPAPASRFLDACFYNGIFAPCLQHWSSLEPARILLALDLKRTSALEAECGSPKAFQTWFDVALTHRPTQLSWFIGQCRWLMGPAASTQLLQRNLSRLDPVMAEALTLEQARGSSAAVATQDPITSALQPLTAALDTYLWALRPIATPPAVLECARTDSCLDLSQVQASIEDGGSHRGSAVGVGLARCAISGLPVGNAKARSEVQFTGSESYLAAALAPA